MSDPYKHAAYDRRYGGTILADDKEIGVTCQCCHCGSHWLMVKGSGRVRGWCTRCNGFVCGAACAECVPYEIKLLWMEGKLPWGTVPQSVSLAPESLPRESRPRAGETVTGAGVILGKA